MRTSVPARSAAADEHRFFTGIALAMLLTVFAGFSRTFFLRPLFPEQPAPPEAFFIVHGAVFSAWMLVFLLQTVLVARGRTAVHRRIGPFGAMLALAMVGLGLHGALIAASRATGFVGVPVPPLQFVVVPFVDMLLFGCFVAFALGNVRTPAHHKRWMLLATVNLLTAAIARWPGVAPMGPLGFFGLTDLFIVALALHDRRALGRIHPVTLWGGLAIIVSQPLRLVISGTEPWQAFARWATALVA